MDQLVQHPTCKLCGREVVVNKHKYNTFEHMHWLCFHIVFEHDGDPDTVCNDVACPWYYINVYERKLTSLGFQPREVYLEAVQDSKSKT